MSNNTLITIDQNIAGFTVKEDLGYFLREGTTYKRHYYLCICKCGKDNVISRGLLVKATNQQLLGCKECKEKILEVKKSLRDMKHRCYREKTNMYPRYGGRGIKVCDRWLTDPMNFVTDMGYKPTKNHTVERLDVDKDYCPENCVWMLNKLQARNRSTTILTQEIVDKIRNLKSLGFASKDCYAQLVISYPQITKIAVWGAYKGKSWKDIDAN